jgi:hypothetical protein
MIIWYPSHMEDLGGGVFGRVDIAIVFNDRHDAEPEFERIRFSNGVSQNGPDRYQVRNVLLPETANENAALAIWRQGRPDDPGNGGGRP